MSYILNKIDNLIDYISDEDELPKINNNIKKTKPLESNKQLILMPKPLYMPIPNTPPNFNLETAKAIWFMSFMFGLPRINSDGSFTKEEPIEQAQERLMRMNILKPCECGNRLIFNEEDDE